MRDLVQLGIENYNYRLYNYIRPTILVHPKIVNPVRTGDTKLKELETVSQLLKGECL